MANSARVLLLHSSGFSSKQWRKLVTPLAVRGYRVINPDLSGHGASPAWPAPTPFTFAIDLAAVLALVDDGEPLHIIGHSYGGFLGLLAARAIADNDPERVLSLTVYDPVSFGVLVGTEMRAQLTQEIARWTSLDDEAWLSTFVDFWGGAGAWLGVREEVRAEFRRTAWVVRCGVHTLCDDLTPASAYTHLRCPVQLMTGATSPPIARAVLDAIAAAVPQARIDVVAGAGHLGPVTHADATNAIIMRTL